MAVKLKGQARTPSGPGDDRRSNDRQRPQYLGSWRLVLPLTQPRGRGYMRDGGLVQQHHTGAVKRRTSIVTASAVHDSAAFVSYHLHRSGAGGARVGRPEAQPQRGRWVQVLCGGVSSQQAAEKHCTQSLHHLRPVGQLSSIRKADRTPGTLSSTSRCVVSSQRTVQPRVMPVRPMAVLSSAPTLYEARSAEAEPEYTRRRKVRRAKRPEMIASVHGGATTS